MEQFLLSLPEQIRRGYELGAACKLPASYGRVDNIIFCGVGGSAIGGDIVAELVAAESPIPFIVSRMSRMPAWVGKNTLAIFSSNSGNTPETLAAFYSAVESGAKILVLTSGGALLEKARELGLPHIVIPNGMPPRCAIGYMTMSLLPVLAARKLLPFSRSQMEYVVQSLQNPPRERAKEIARRLKDKHIFLYGHARFFAPVVKRWRAQLAENAKTISSHHLLPEMLHNEIEGWTFPPGFPENSAVVFILDPELSAKIKEKIQAARQLMCDRGADVIDVDAPSGILLSRIFGLISLGDWVSYKLALLNGVDPVPIPLIESLKKKY